MITLSLLGWITPSMDTPSIAVGLGVLNVSAQQPALSTNPIQSFAEWDEARFELALETAHTVDQLRYYWNGKIEYLALGNNRIDDLQPLSDLSQLDSLFVFSNEISDLTPLEPLTELRSRSLGYNPVEEVSFLANLYALEELLLFHILVTDVSPIEALVQLSWLDLYNTPIEETTALENLLQLTWLDRRGINMRDRTCPVQPKSVCLFSITRSQRTPIYHASHISL